MIRVMKKVGGKIKEGSIKDIKANSFTWVDSFRPSKDELQQISKILKIPFHDLSRYLDPDERPKVVEFDYCSLIVFGCPTAAKDFAITPLAIFITRNHVITLRTDEIKAVTNP